MLMFINYLFMCLRKRPVNDGVSARIARNSLRVKVLNTLIR